MTNREKLMQMSDEDFAELLCKATTICNKCPAFGECGWDEYDHPESLIKWLREESKDENQCK